MADKRDNKLNCHKLNFLLIWLGNMNNDKQAFLQWAV